MDNRAEDTEKKNREKAEDTERKNRAAQQKQMDDLATLNSAFARMGRNHNNFPYWERTDQRDPKAPPGFDGAAQAKILTEYLDAGVYARVPSAGFTIHLDGKGTASVDWYPVTDGQYREQFEAIYDLLISGKGADTIKPMVSRSITRERLNIHFELAAERNVKLDLTDPNVEKFLRSLSEEEQKFYRDAQAKLVANFEQQKILREVAQSGGHVMNAANISNEARFIVDGERDKLVQKRDALMAASAPAIKQKEAQAELDKFDNDVKTGKLIKKEDFSAKLITGTVAEQLAALKNAAEENGKRLSQLETSFNRVERGHKATEEILKDPEKIASTQALELPTSTGRKILDTMTFGLTKARDPGTNKAFDVIGQLKQANLANAKAENDLLDAAKKEIEDLKARFVILDKKDNGKTRWEQLNDKIKALPDSDAKKKMETELAAAKEQHEKMSDPTSLKSLNFMERKKEQLDRYNKDTKPILNDQINEKIKKEEEAQKSQVFRR